MSTAALADAPFRLSDSPTPVELVAKYFRVLGDPTRLRIVELIEGGELSVGTLVERLGLSQSHVSNHLACLRWCGFVETRREHRSVFYRLADHRVAEVVELARQLLAANADHVAACQRIDGKAC
jgi:ArsR family transcriptional regulator, cadmium/lead-responsive transcriptional repressor